MYKYKIKVMIGNHATGILPGVYGVEVFDEVDRLNLLAASMNSLSVYLVEVLH
jgi:hypothetical protein